MSQLLDCHFWIGFAAGCLVSCLALWTWLYKLFRRQNPLADKLESLSKKHPSP